MCRRDNSELEKYVLKGGLYVPIAASSLSGLIDGQHRLVAQETSVEAAQAYNVLRRLFRTVGEATHQYSGEFRYILNELSFKAKDFTKRAWALITRVRLARVKSAMSHLTTDRMPTSHARETAQKPDPEAHLRLSIWSVVPVQRRFRSPRST